MRIAQPSKARLLSVIDKHVGSLGFRRKGTGWSKPTAFGSHHLFLHFIDHTGEPEVNANVGVRVDAVEQLVRRFTKAASLLSDNDAATTLTLWSELGNVVERRQRLWKLNDRQLERTGEEIARLFLSVGIPVLSRFSTLEAIGAALSGPRDEAEKFSPFPIVRAKSAVATALILRDHVAFEAIAAKKLDELRGQRGLEEFESMVTTLRDEFR